jgi:hypothetical protein
LKPVAMTDILRFSGSIIVNAGIKQQTAFSNQLFKMFLVLIWNFKIHYRLHQKLTAGHH